MYIKKNSHVKLADNRYTTIILCSRPTSYKIFFFSLNAVPFLYYTDKDTFDFNNKICVIIRS